ncbi:MAG: YjfB family protein [Phycisphaerales bacterium]
MDMTGMDGLASGLMGMQQGKLQYEVGIRVAAKVLDAARDEGRAMVGMVNAAAKVMEAGQKGLEKGIEGALGALDVYA